MSKWLDNVFKRIFPEGHTVTQEFTFKGSGEMSDESRIEWNRGWADGWYYGRKHHFIDERGNKNIMGDFMRKAGVGVNGGINFSDYYSRGFPEGVRSFLHDVPEPKKNQL